ncbi:MAG: CoB--CoM heterodisulfide reductase iron-sulfur subunit B family protein [Anaerolineales bacterium]|jgi:heterodisulfide reductase subunit B
MMKYAYYPGCSLEGISVEYDLSMRRLFEQLEVTVEDLPEWICCGTLAAPSMSRLLGVATPLWNVARATLEGFDQLIAPCSACVYHFKNAVKQVEDKPDLRIEVENVLEMSLESQTPTIHPLELLVQDSFEERIKSSLKRDLSDLKVVAYYGCHISRPAKVMQFDDPENPQSMDQILEWAGAQVLDWSAKVDCCGAHFSMIKPEIAVDLCSQLIKAALQVGADAIVVACPMCHANLDTRQEMIAEKMDRPLDLPVFYFSQVLGYAMGLGENQLGMTKHLVDPLPLMLEKCRQRNGHDHTLEKGI